MYLDILNMDSLIKTYLFDLRTSLDDEDKGCSILKLIYETINMEIKNIDLNLEILFNDSWGLIHYMKTLTKNADINTDLIKELQILITCFIKDFTKSFEKYSFQLKEYFRTVILQSANANLKYIAYEIMMLLFNTYNGYFQQDLEWVKQLYIKILHSKTEDKISSNEKKKAYLLIGEIVATFPEIIDDKLQPQLFRHLLHQIRKQLEFESKKSVSFKVSEMEGLFECLQQFLKSFHRETYVINCKELYSFIKEGCSMMKHRRTSIRAAFKILELHFPLFAENIYSDCILWNNLLMFYLTSMNKDDQQAALHVFKVFYPGIAKILKRKHEQATSDDKETLKYFLVHLKSGLNKRNNTEIALAAENFGYFGSVCKSYGELTELQNMFVLVIQMTENYCVGQSYENIELYHLSGLLLSMAKISKYLYREDAGGNDFNVLAKFTSFVISMYPKVPNHFQFIVRNNVIKTIVTVAKISERFLDSYLDKMMVISLIKCCSCPLERDIEFIKTLGNISNPCLSSLTDYTSIWKSICNIERTLKYSGIISEKTKIDVLFGKNLPSKIFDKFINSVLVILDKLDLSTTDKISSSNNIISGNERELKPKMESDFYIFVNLVELFTIVTSDVDSDYLLKWTPILVKKFIQLSTICPLRSGFYELLTAVFRNSKFEYLNRRELLDVQEVEFFLSETLIHIHQLDGVELITCLRMILYVPDVTIDSISYHLTPLLQMVFTIGIENLDIANDGLAALQKWKNFLPRNRINTILKDLLPFLNPYLRSKKSVGDAESLSQYEQQLLMSAISQPNNKFHKMYRQACDETTDSKLLEFQKNLLKFLSGVDNELCTPIFDSEKQCTNEFTDMLRFQIPFTDVKVKVLLDKILARVVELTSHSDMKTRIAACEMLHSITVIFLGNSQNFEQKFSPSSENLFRKLINSVLKMGSDNNLVIKGIFCQLSFQIARYYASKHQYQSHVTDLLLEILFDNVCNERDISLRHFSSNIINEFIKESLNSRSSDGTGSAHILAVIKRICMFSVQPSVFKRLGAALVFNSIYREIRERVSLLNIYWIELLVFFVKSFNMSTNENCCDEQCSRALDHIERVFVEKPEFFAKSNSTRRVPKCLSGGTLSDTISWILNYCLSENEKCRTKCMKLVVNFLTKLPEYNCLKLYLMKNQVEKEVLMSKCTLIVPEWRLKGDKKIILKQLGTSSAALHCLFWLIQEHVIEFEPTLDVSNRFWSFLSAFCTYISVPEGDDYNTFAGRDFEALSHDIFFQCLNIISVNGSINNLLGSDPWQQSFWIRLISCLFKPSNLSSSSKAEPFIRVIVEVLSALKRVPRAEAEHIYLQIMENKCHESFDTFLDHINSDDFIPVTQKQYVTALITLQNAGIIHDIFPDVGEKKEKIIRQIFNFINDDGKAKICSSPVTLQLQSLVSFAIKDFEVIRVLNLLTDASQLHLQNSTFTIAHGHYFLQNFKIPVVAYLFQHQPDIVINYLAPYSLSKEKILIISNCLKYASEFPKPLIFTELIEGIFNCWHILVSWSSTSDCLDHLFTLLDAIVNQNVDLKNLKSDPMSIFLWLINLLSSDKDCLLRKKDILRLLSAFIKNASNESNVVLRDKLKYFETEFLLVSPQTKTDESEFINLFNELLNLFCRSQNTVVFQTVMSIGSSDVNEFYDLNIQQALENVMKTNSYEDQMKLLDLSFLRVHGDGSVNSRLNCTQRFLIPLLYMSNKETLKLFFSSKLQEILQNMKKPFIEAENQISEQNLILLKTVAVRIVEVYSEVECDELKEAIEALKLPGIQKVNSFISKTILHIVTTPIQLKDASNEEILRKLKCYSYNTLIKIVRKVPKDEKFYANLFFEQPSLQKWIWQSIIDCTREIKLNMNKDKLSARKKTLKKKKQELKSKATSSIMTSFPTQYLSTSSLVSDMQYDMSEWNISNDTSVVQLEKKTYELNLDDDALNEHECMATICELIIYLVESGISPAPDVKSNPTPEPPLWMMNIRESFKNAVNRGQKNIIMYIIKIINNCDNEFYPYGASWVELIIKGLLVLSELNYLVIDTISTILCWHNIAVPKDKQKNNQLLDLLIENSLLVDTSMRNYQLRVISCVIRVWNSALDVPYSRLNLIKDMTKSQLDVCLNICKEFLLVEILPFLYQNTQDFIAHLFYFLNRSTVRSQKILIFEIVALILKVSIKADLIPEFREKLRDDLVQILNSLKINTTKSSSDLFFSSLYHTLIYFPDVLHCFAPYLLQTFEKYQGKLKLQCLKIIAIDIEQLPKNAFIQLLSQKFTNSFREHNHEILKSALLILKMFIHEIEVNELKKLMPEVLRLSTFSNTECRQLVYDIADSVFVKYKDANDETSVEILNQTKLILLNGLLDNDQILQETIFASWKTRCGMSDKIRERLLCILQNMYSPQNENRFINNTVEYLLEASSLTPDFKSKIFDNPLGYCEFKEQNFSRLVSLRNKNSIAPMFINSMSSQMLEMSIQTLKPGTLFHQKLPLFEQTLIDSEEDESSSFGSNKEQDISRIQYSSRKLVTDCDPALKKLRRYTPLNQHDASEFHAARNIEKREKKEKLVSSKSERLERSISLSRSYRDGSFPDIEIPRSAVVMPMRVLARKDPVFAKLVFISIFDGMLKEISDKKSYLNIVSNCFNDILAHSLQYDNILIETLFETSFFYPADIILNVQSSIISSHTEGLLSLGTLVIENNLSIENVAEKQRAPKRLKLDDTNTDNLWVQLAEFYSSLNKTDVVNGILKEKLKQCEVDDLRKGLEFEQNGKLKDAYNLYKNKVNGIFSKDVRSCEDRFILEAYFKCAAKLAKWSEMKNIISEKFKTNLDDLWNKNWDCIIPWFFISEGYDWAYTGSPPAHNYLAEMKKWLSDERKIPILTNTVAESLSVLLFLNGENLESRKRASTCIEIALENWSSSVPSLENFSKLQLLSEIDSMLVPFEVSVETISVEAVEKVINIWKSCLPQPENSVWWDRRTVYRQRFAESYLDHLAEDENHTREKLKTFCMNAALQMVDLSLLQKNDSVACHFLINCSQNNAFNEEDSVLLSQFELCQSKILLLKGLEETIIPKKIGNIRDSLESLAAAEQINQKHLYYLHLANTLRTIIEEPNLLSLEELKINVINFLNDTLHREDTDTDTVHHIIYECVISNYEKAAEFAKFNNDTTKVAEAYLSLAKFCKTNITKVEGLNVDENIRLKNLLIRSILRAMKFDSEEAQLLFPILLQIDDIICEELKSTFITECSNIEEWKFLMWIQQLLAYIESDTYPAIENIILRIIEKYPNAIQFSILSNISNFNHKTENTKKFCHRLQKILNPSDIVSSLVNALSCVQIPEIYLRQFIQNLLEILKTTSLNSQSEISILEENFFSDEHFKGILYTENELWQKIKDILCEMKGNSSSNSSIIVEIQGILANLTNELKNINKFSVCGNNKRKFLRNYSSWFDNFSNLEATNIEIPGQYSGVSRPHPQYHVKIFDFDSCVSIQTSAQLPIKLSIIGDDAKKYPYLIKFGEDLRQDARIQQIFSIIKQCTRFQMNRLQESTSVITYGVFPLNSNFGLIEWLEPTCTLRDFMDYHLSESGKKSRQSLKDNLNQRYVQELMNYHPGSSKEIAYYEEAIKKCSKIRITTIFRNLSREIPDDVFKKSLLALCNSPILYWHIRNQFITSYSTLCIYGWILGIGDRHLKNTLVCLKTGSCIGIDFGHAFGTGIECLPVPELIPFRMTPHLVSVMAPFYCTGLIRETMINVLRVICKNDEVLLAAMKIFILDPSFNWLNKTRKWIQEKECREKSIDEMKWYPAQKIAMVERKLQGINPLEILTEEINGNRIISPSYAEACVRLLKRENKRETSFSKNVISVAEQVESLLDIATDECILGTSWRGLETYI